MVRRISAFFALCFLFVALNRNSAFAAKITVKNTLGGDLDELGDSDFFSRTKAEDIYGETETENALSLGDQLQVDLDTKTLDARIRLEFLLSNADAAEAKFIFSPSGFAHYEPIPQFGVVAGNSFYKRFAADSGYLAAADDTTKYGRLLTDSLGEDRYFGTNAVAVHSRGIAGGLTSGWNFGAGGKVYAKAAAGLTAYPDSDFEKAFDFGLNAGVEDIFDLAFTAHDALEDGRKFGVFAGYTGIRDLVANVGFYYNFTDSDFLPEACVERSGAFEFKKQNTKYALSLSGGYLFASGLGLYADFITGLTNEYIGEVKYYDADGNLAETRIETIVRGETVVKYKDGVAKRTDGFPAETIPFCAQIRIAYKVNSVLDTALNLKIRSWLYDTDESDSWVTLHPRCSVKLPRKLGTAGAGLRLDWNGARGGGLTGISVPLTYSYKFKKKF